MNSISLSQEKCKGHFSVQSKGVCKSDPKITPGQRDWARQHLLSECGALAVMVDYACDTDTVGLQMKTVWELCPGWNCTPAKFLC